MEAGYKPPAIQGFPHSIVALIISCGLCVITKNADNYQRLTEAIIKVITSLS